MDEITPPSHPMFDKSNYQFLTTKKSLQFIANKDIHVDAKSIEDVEGVEGVKGVNEFQLFFIFLI